MIAVSVRGFGFGNDAGLAFYQVDHLLKREYLGTGEFWIFPRAGIELLDFLERELDDGPGPFAFYLDRAVWKDLGDVRGSFQGGVVQADQHAVFGHLQVGFNEVGALSQGQLVGRAGMLGGFAGRPAVSDQRRLGVRRQCRWFVSRQSDGRPNAGQQEQAAGNTALETDESLCGSGEIGQCAVREIKGRCNRDGTRSVPAT